MFLGPATGQLVIRIEIVIDLDAVLMAPESVGISAGARAAGNRAAGPSIDGCVQAINGNRRITNCAGAVKRVRPRHVWEQLLHEAARVHSPSEWITGIHAVAEYAEALHWTGCSRYASPVQRITRPVDDRSNSRVS